MKSKEILLITSFPPRKCGIATYSQDLIHAIEDKYEDAFRIKICALKKKDIQLEYPHSVSFLLKSWIREDYLRLANDINANNSIQIIYLQHEFGLYDGEYGEYILDFLKAVKTPVIKHSIPSFQSLLRKGGGW